MVVPGNNQNQEAYDDDDLNLKEKLMEVEDKIHPVLDM